MTAAPHHAKLAAFRMSSSLCMLACRERCRGPYPGERRDILNQQDGATPGRTQDMLAFPWPTRENCSQPPTEPCMKTRTLCMPPALRSTCRRHAARALSDETFRQMLRCRGAESCSLPVWLATPTFTLPGTSISNGAHHQRCLSKDCLTTSLSMETTGLCGRKEDYAAKLGSAIAWVLVCGTAANIVVAKAPQPPDWPAVAPANPSERPSPAECKVGCVGVGCHKCAHTHTVAGVRQRVTQLQVIKRMGQLDS